MEAALARDVRAFRVEFLPPKAEGETATFEDWQDRWDSGERSNGQELPLAMRVTLTLAGRNGRVLTETLDVNIPQSAGSISTGSSTSEKEGDSGGGASPSGDSKKKKTKKKKGKT